MNSYIPGGLGKAGRVVEVIGKKSLGFHRIRDGVENYRH